MLLRDQYQQKFIKNIFSEFRKGARAVCAVAPTAFGKTHCFLKIAREVAAQGLRVEIVVSLKHLIRQMHQAMTDAGIEHGVIAPGFPQTDHLIQLSSIQTRVNRLNTAPVPYLVIGDECHHMVSTQYRRFLDSLPATSRIIGFTATPERLDGVGLGIQNGGIFDALVVAEDIPQLMADNILAHPIVYWPEDSADMSDCPISMGDYVKKEAVKRVNKARITGSAVLHYLQYVPGLPAIAFTINVEHAYEVAAEFNKAGVSAAVLEGKMSDRERDRVLDSFAAGEIKVLVSCMLISEGFDIPGIAIAAVFILRPTESLQVWLQQIGRVLRNPFYPEPRNVYLFDHVGNVAKPHLGPPDLPRTWSLVGVKRAKKDTGITPYRTRRCMECGACWKGSTTECACGYVFTTERDGFQYMEGELARMDAMEEKAAEKMKAAQQAAQKKREQALCNTYEELLAHAIKWNYKDPQKFAFIVNDARRQKAHRRVKVCGMSQEDFAGALGRALYKAAEKPRKGTTRQLLEQIMFEIYPAEVAQASAWLTNHCDKLAEFGVQVLPAYEDDYWTVRRNPVGGTTQDNPGSSDGGARVPA